MPNRNASSRVISSVATASLGALLAVTACGASAEKPTSDDRELAPAPDGGEAAAVPAADTPSSTADGGAVPPCDSKQTAAIQARLDADAPAGIDAVALIKDPSCGVRFFSRGPSKIPRDALHLLASNTKTYLASLILLLAEDGVLTLDEPISRWIGNVPGGDAIVVRHLLNHTSGIYNYSDSVLFRAQSTFGKKYSPQELVDLAFGQKTYFAAGAGWAYSNTNYTLLGMIAEKAAGQPVEKLLRDRILTKVGAEHTFFYGKEQVNGQIAPGRTFLGGTNGATFNDPSTFWCSGSYVGTPDDLLAFVELRSSGKLHSSQSNAEMLKTVKVSDTLEYGAGMMVYQPSVTHGGGKAYGHGGDLVGYHSYGLYFPERNATVVLIVDSDAGPSGSFPFSATYREPLWFSLIDPLFGYEEKDGG